MTSVSKEYLDASLAMRFLHVHNNMPFAQGGALSTCTYGEVCQIFLGQNVAYPGYQSQKIISFHLNFEALVPRVNVAKSDSFRSKEN